MFLIEDPLVLYNPVSAVVPMAELMSGCEIRALNTLAFPK